jgi:hypothetical protein
VLLDPYGQTVAIPPHYSRRAAHLPGDNTADAMESAVADLQAYDWQGDAPLQHAFAHTIIYDAVAEFTRHPSSGVAPAQRGTYAGPQPKRMSSILALLLLPLGRTCCLRTRRRNLVNGHWMSRVARAVSRGTSHPWWERWGRWSRSIAVPPYWPSPVRSPPQQAR